MLTLLAPQPESLWDESLPVEVKELPEDLAALDRLLSDPELLWPLVGRWQHEFHETGRLVLTEGRPTIALETYVRLMVLKQRYRWGYRTLVAEVSDSIHLRRFCRISLSERMPDESTVRKLRAALEALRGDGAPASRGLHAGRTTKPVVETLSRNHPVNPGGGSEVTPAEPKAVDGNDATRDPPVERAVRQLREELAAGLRNR